MAALPLGVLFGWLAAYIFNVAVGYMGSLKRLRQERDRLKEQVRRLGGVYPLKPDLADELLDLWGEGVHEILNGETRLEDQKNAWLFKERDWRHRIRDVLVKHDCTKQEKYRVLLIKAFTTGAFDPDPKLNKRKSIVSERLNRIAELIERYSGEPFSGWQ